MISDEHGNFKRKIKYPANINTPTQTIVKGAEKSACMRRLKIKSGDLLLN
jgi:hypothetical protein